MQPVGGTSHECVMHRGRDNLVDRIVPAIADPPDTDAELPGEPGPRQAGRARPDQTAVSDIKGDEPRQDAVEI